MLEKAGQTGLSEMVAKFTYSRVVLDHKSLNYNPCDDLIFPCVIQACKYFSSPLGKYYMYYSPHNSPGGICLAYADSLTGPWHEYARNPIIRNDWSPYYSVTHVSSPHALWIPEFGSLFLYFHGENSCTRYAISDDGIDFEYGGIAVTEADFNCDSGAFYARVFPHTIPGLNNSYIMLLMCHLSGRSAIFLAHSADGRHWQTIRDPILLPPEGSNLHYLCSPFFLGHKGRYYIVFHGDMGDMANLSTDIYAMEVDEGLRNIKFAGKLFAREKVSRDNLRVSDPFIIREGDLHYLFCSTGSRLNQVISVATAGK